MPLDPDVRALLDEDDTGRPLAELTLEEARAVTRGVVALQPHRAAPAVELDPDGGAVRRPRSGR